MAKKDDNGIQPIYGVSHLDGTTLIPIQFIAAYRGMKVDTTTAIAFDPATIRISPTDNDLPIAKGTSSTDNTTILPWVVHATTGAVLIDE